jgi:hypothetical protein
LRSWKALSGEASHDRDQYLGLTASDQSFGKQDIVLVEFYVPVRDLIDGDSADGVAGAWAGVPARTLRRGSCRTAQVREARKTAIYLADGDSGLGRPGLAVAFSTTRTEDLHALAKAETRIAREPDFAALLEKLRANVASAMQNRTDQHAVSVLGVEHDMRLKPKAPESGLEVVGALPNTGEVRE